MYRAMSPFWGIVVNGPITPPVPIVSVAVSVDPGHRAPPKPQQVSVGSATKLGGKVSYTDALVTAVELLVLIVITYSTGAPIAVWVSPYPEQSVALV
jgi:hypothetical protein